MPGTVSDPEFLWARLVTVKKSLFQHHQMMDSDVSWNSLSSVVNPEPVSVTSIPGFHKSQIHIQIPENWLVDFMGNPIYKWMRKGVPCTA